MWFKNLIIFQLDADVDWHEDALLAGLEKKAFKPCAPQQANSMGWVAPMGELSEQLVHSGSGMFLLTARREDRVMPAAVIKDAVEERVLEIEKREQRKVGRKQKMDLRDETIFAMMPKAFTRSNRVQGLIIPAQNLLVVDCANRNKAEEWVSLLRESLSGMPAKPVEVKQSVSGLLTAWLNGKTPIPAALEIGDECELQAFNDERSLVMCRRQDLSGAEIKPHLKAGKGVTKLALEWKQALSFVINEGLEIKKFKLSDVTIEQATEQDGVDKAAEFDARFTVMALQIAGFLPEIWKLFGGLHQDT